MSGSMISRALIIIETRDDLTDAQKKLRKVVVSLLNDEHEESTPILMDLLEIAESMQRSITRLKHGS